MEDWLSGLKRFFAKEVKVNSLPRVRISHPPPFLMWIIKRNYLRRLKASSSFGCLAQLVEQGAFNSLVVGSNPAAPTNF